MGRVIEAVYEKGVFKPLQKVDLKEGERVKIMIKRNLIDIIKSYQDKFKLKKDDVEEFLRKRR